LTITLTLLLLLSFSAPAAAGPVGAAGPVWRSECVDCPVPVFQIGDRSLALDAAGWPHVVYAGDRLYYAHFDGTAWQIETVDEAPGLRDPVEPAFQSSASLALDQNGLPHISYLNATSTALRYAHKTDAGGGATAWQIETIETAAPGQWMAYDSCIQLDRQGRPHIAFSNYGWLRYASWTGSRWEIQTVDNSAWIEWYISLALDDRDALDGSDAPRISYFAVGAHTSQLRYTEWVGGAWRRQVLDEAVWLGEFNSLALDSTGAPHISYLDVTHSQLKYARRNGAAWEITVLETVRWWGGYTSIAVDNRDRPHVTYGGPPVGIRYARATSGAGGAWEIESVPGGGWFTSLALDAADQPHMVYFDTAGRRLVYGRRDAAGWRLQAVDRLADVGSFTALALDAAGALAAAYYEAGHGDLRFARQSGSQWQIETVDSGAAAAGNGVGAEGDVGQYASLACDPAGACWISYYDATSGDLKAAHRQMAGPWQVETVDSGAAVGLGTADVGRYTAIALDAAGAPWISYYDATNGNLKLAHRNVDARWSVETVDSGAVDGIGVDAIDGDVGRHTAIALADGGAAIWISYYDATAGDLKAAHRKGDGGAGTGAWLIETADGGAGDDVGAETSLALDAAGVPHVSYYDATHGDLKYAARLGGQWRVTTVDAVDAVDVDSAVGRHSSLALDPAGQPRISYTSADNGALRYAAWAAGAWSITELRRGWQVAGATALVLEASGRARISFYDPGWRSLRLATGSPFGVYLPIIGTLAG